MSGEVYHHDGLYKTMAKVLKEKGNFQPIVAKGVIKLGDYEPIGFPITPQVCEGGYWMKIFIKGKWIKVFLDSNGAFSITIGVKEDKIGQSIASGNFITIIDSNIAIQEQIFTD